MFGSRDPCPLWVSVHNFINNFHSIIIATKSLCYFYQILISLSFSASVFLFDISVRLTVAWFTFFIYLLNFIYRWYIKIAFANKFQPYHKIQYNIYYILHIKHPQSISPIFLILFLNSNNELLDFTTAGRLFHIREPRKWIAFVP